MDAFELGPAWSIAADVNDPASVEIRVSNRP